MTVQAEDERIKPYVVERVVILAKEKTCKKWRAESGRGVHQRVPVFLGSKDDVAEMRSYYDKK